jgi:uncharacterized protein YceK
MRYLLMIVVMLFIKGCSSVTKENYDKLHVGMTYAQVSDIFGKAKHCDSFIGMRDCMWGDETHYIKIKFVDDKVMLISSKGLK